MNFPLKLPFTLYITREDILEGTPCESRTCPTALSLHRRFGPKSRIRVGYKKTDIYQYDEKDNLKCHWLIRHPQKLIDWIVEYDKDNAEMPKPIRIKITNIQEELF